MQGQGDRERDASSNTLTNINPDQQRQMDFFREWLNQGSPGTLIGQMMESGIDSENHRRAFMELMNQVDAELNARGIGFQRTNPDSGQVGNESLMVQQANVSSAHHTIGIDLNATPGQRREFGGGQTLSIPTKPDGPVAAADRNARPAAGADSSNPILISSGVGNALKADDDAGGQGHGQGGASSSNNRRTSFKRRAPGDAPRQLLLGESSSSVQQEQARESEQEDVVAAPQENAGTVALNNEITEVGMLGVANSSAMNGTQNVAAAGITVLEAGIGGVPTVNHHRPSSVAAANGLGGGSVMNQNQTSNEARNGAASPGLTNNNNQASIRARQTEIFQRNIRARRNPNLRDFTPTASMLTQSSPSQTAMFYSFDDFVNSLPQPQFPPTPAAQIVQDLEPFQTQQVQGITMPSGSPSSSARTPQLQPRNVLFRAAEFEPGNLSHMAANMNLANGNTNFPGNNAAAAAAAQDGSNSSSRISAVPIWYPRQAINYSNRMLEVLRRAESRGLHGDYRTREMDNSSRGDNMRPQPRTSRLMPRDERQDGDDPDITLSGRPLASEVRNVLARVRIGAVYTLEDIPVTNRSVFFGPPEDEEDVLEDMRLDIDDMTYEELLALGDEIGTVCTGLREETILANLRVQKYESESPGNDGSCCICQEEYANGEDLGKLDCGHGFHANCIKQWLGQKNQCPICKMKGLACKHRER